MNHDHTISVVLPVRNQQSTVAMQIESLLDELADLTSQVQIVAVDDASHDATVEVLDDIRTRFPQVTMIANSKSIGAKASAQQGLSAVTGEFVFVQETFEPIDMDGVRRLWDLRTDDDLVMAKVRTFKNEIDDELLESLTNFAKQFEKEYYAKRGQEVEVPIDWASKLPTESRRADGQLQMLRKDAMSPAAASKSGTHLEMQRRTRSSILER